MDHIQRQQIERDERPMEPFEITLDLNVTFYGVPGCCSATVEGGFDGSDAVDFDHCQIHIMEFELGVDQLVEAKSQLSKDEREAVEQSIRHFIEGSDEFDVLAREGDGALEGSIEVKLPSEQAKAA